MPVITELFAYIVCDSGPDDEGVPSFSSPIGHRPMMGADMARAAPLRQYAQFVANQLEKPVRLYRFTGKELVDTIEPRGGGE
jgi:hypothetical protein